MIQLKSEFLRPLIWHIIRALERLPFFIMNSFLLPINYLASFHKIKESSVPKFDLDTEYDLQQTITSLIRKNVIESAHDISNGGLFISLIESCFQNNLGFEIVSSSDVREDAFLFGESPSRVIVSVTETGEDTFLDALNDKKTPFMLLGHVTKGRVVVDDVNFGDISDYKKIYNNSLKDKLEN